MYKSLRPLLFRLDPEQAHHLTFSTLRQLYRIPGPSALVRALYAARTPALPVDVMGLRFPNPIGLAAGLDKNGDYLAPLADLGFGWLEIGTVTPRPQPGNPRKRLFRLPAQAALINRMGFNNRGLDAVVANLRAGKPGIVGVNIGKNKDTPLEHAADDYVAGLRAVYALADYVAVNISSPNTPQLRALQGEEQLDPLLGALKTEQARLKRESGRYVPLAVKVAPDLSSEEIRGIAERLLAHGIDGLIATNTTVTRPGLAGVPLAQETGGLSGRPLRPLATGVIAAFYRELEGRIPIIGVGGVESAEDAWEKLLAGADLVQVYTGLIFEGPAVVRRIVARLAHKVRASGGANLAQALASARPNLSSGITPDAIKK